MVAGELEQDAYLHDPDVQLMLRAQQGDEAAFTELVTNYQDRLVSVFQHMLGDQGAAEDLAQETFLRIYRTRHGYKPTAKFSTWLFRIANNLASNSRRSRGRRKEVQLAPQDLSNSAIKPMEQVIPEKSALMPTRQVARTELRAQVQAALDTLSERHKLAVLLHKFEDMSYVDIAATMDMSTAAVKSLLSRARENLREQLQNYIG